MALSGYEVLGNFLSDQANNIRSDTLRKHEEGRADSLRAHEEARQERLLKEGREYSHATKLEDEKRAYADGLIAAGLLQPNQRDDPAAVAAAWAKTTPDFKVEFKEKLELRDELSKYVAAGVISPPPDGGPIVFDNADIETLRTVVNAARQQAGQTHQANLDLEAKYKQSQITENEALAKSRIGSENRSTNAAYWTAEANKAADDYENAQLDQTEIRDAQVAAANSPGAETSPDLYQRALQKATEAILKNKRSAAWLRLEAAKNAARVGAAMPADIAPAAAHGVAPSSGASVAPVDPNAKIQGFLNQGQGAPAAAPGPGASVAPASGAPPPPPSPGGPGITSAIVTGASMLPLEKLAPLAPLGNAVPLARAGVLGYQLGSSINSAFPNNPLARVGAAAGTDIARMVGVLPGPQDYRRPLPGSSVGNPYQ